MSVIPKQKGGELLGLALIALSIFFFLSLFGFSVLDPSLNVSGPSSSFSNYCGKVGAYTSDALLQLLGLSAFLLPLLLVLFGFRKLLGRGSDYPFLQALGGCFLLFSVCAGAFLFGNSIPFSLDYAPGGVIGLLLGRLLLNYLNTAGALLVVLTALVATLLLTTRFSFEALVNWMSNREWSLFSNGLFRYENWKKRRHDRRELRHIQGDNNELLAPPRKLVLDQEEQTSRKRKKQSGGPLVTSATAEGGKTRAPKVEPLGARLPFELPSLDFLQLPKDDIVVDEAELIAQSEKLTAKYAEFDVLGRVLQIHPGPVVTTFEFKPNAGIKYSRVTSLADDLCLGLKAESLRIDRIPGKNTVGIEVPNQHRHTIMLREILSSTAFQESDSFLTLGLGKLINGNTYVTNLAQMPHLLIAGSTGSGKSVAINCLICSILYKSSPEDVKFIMVDPKRLELGLYADIPHLLTPIVTDPKQASNALNWAVREMEERYRLLAQQGVRDLKHYNQVVNELPDPASEDEDRPEPLPLIVLIVDELADLMMTSGKEVEAALTRLAQMARAVGIHLILATQRPSVDVITGLIKANFPSRVSFRVSSKVDSRTILDSNGAEQLLGQGDMLFLSPRTARSIRLHGGLISETEIKKITDFLRSQAEPDYRQEILEGKEDHESSLVDPGDLDDPLYSEAARLVVETGKASTSLLQRRLRIGYGRAARLLDIMEHEGIVGPPEGSRPREILVPANYYAEIDNN
jgi:S-DNA-T family DNA segregation ATPase FtsK/SpoIIIE